MASVDDVHAKDNEDRLGIFAMDEIYFPVPVWLCGAQPDMQKYSLVHPKERKSSFVEGQSKNLIDFYIEHMGKVNDCGGHGQNSFLGQRGRINSVSALVELFVGGGETVSTTLKWAAIYLSHHPYVQDKLQNEIDDVIGRERDPLLLDRERMPYTEAVIMETLRHSSIIPLGVTHELLDDVTFHGYKLPKGLLLMANMYHIHHDPAIWGDPDKFRPDRFLEEEGHRLKEYLVPFQAGKRQCLGIPLTKDVLFLFVAKLFQEFTFRPDPRISKADYFKQDVGLLLLPKCSEFLIALR